MANEATTIKKAKQSARKYICRVRPLTVFEREALKQRIIIELSRINK